MILGLALVQAPKAGAVILYGVMALFLFTGRMKTTLYTNPKGVLMENKEVLEEDVLKK